MSGSRDLTWSQRVGRVWMVAVVTAAAVVMVTAGPAHAVSGLQYVTASTGSDSTSPKSLAITCPSGKVAISGGAYLTGAVGNVTIRQVKPMQFLSVSLVSVLAQEDPDGYSGSWSLAAVAVCVKRPVGFTYVNVSLTDPSYVWVTASCGAKRIIGSGYAVSDTALAKASGPQIDSRNRAYLSVEASQLPGAIHPVTGTAVAACADAALPGMVWPSTTTPMNSNNGKVTSTRCPAGTQVIGIGGDLYGWRPHTVIDDLIIVPATNSVSVAGYEDQVGTPDPWAIMAYAVCAT